MNISLKTAKKNNELFEAINSANSKSTKPLSETDAEFLDIVADFALDEVWEHSDLDKSTRMLLILASMIAQNLRPRFKLFLAVALKIGVTPEKVKELVYHCAPYCGVARIFDFICDTNEALESCGFSLPVNSRGIVTRETRFKKGLDTQKSIFGDTIDKMRASAPADQKHIQDYLSANCFGDHYTREGLSVKTRELITFAILVSLGGCDPQVKGHIRGNANVGNGKDVLIDAATQLLPYIGYPRALNAFSCINEVLSD